MLMRLRYKLIGSHVHVRVFTALSHSTTWAESGVLVFRKAEFEELFSHDPLSVTAVLRGLDFALVHEDIPTTIESEKKHPSMVKNA